MPVASQLQAWHRESQSSDLLFRGKKRDLAQLTFCHSSFWSVFVQQSHCILNGRVKLQQLHNLGYPCPGHSLPVRNLGLVFTFTGVDLPLPLFSLGQPLHDGRRLQPLGS